MDLATETLLTKLLTLSPLEKNVLYHRIILLLRGCSIPEQQANLVIQEFCQILSDKKFQIMEDSLTTDIPSSIKQGKIFRRVG